MTPATARTRAHSHAPAKRVAPHGARRVSGPVARRVAPAPAGARTLPRRGTTSVFARIRALPEHRVVDRLLHSRAWIWALGILLGGIVAMQVSLLKLNSGISRAVETATTLERQNAAIEAQIARKSSPDRISVGADQLGMVMPAAGDVGYLQAGPQDATRAVRRMEPPSDAAAALLANNGVVPGSLVAPTTTATTATPAATPVPAATPAAVTTTTTTPAATPDPAAAAAAPTPAAPATVPAQG
jgi:hypothetical protein